MSRKAADDEGSALIKASGLSYGNVHVYVPPLQLPGSTIGRRAAAFSHRDAGWSLKWILCLKDMKSGRVSVISAASEWSFELLETLHVLMKVEVPPRLRV